MAAARTFLDQAAPVDSAARSTLRGLATGGRLHPMLRSLLLDALLNESRSDHPHDPAALASGAARSATEWIGASVEEREKCLLELLNLADALPPQPKQGPPLADKVSSVHAALDEGRIPHAFGGALALGYYGEPRATGDIDINAFIALDDVADLRASLAPLHLHFEIDTRELSTTNELLVDWGSTPFHLFLASDLLHEQMGRSTREVPFNGGAIRLVAPEHLTVRKAILDRPKDWHDIEQILVATSPLNLEEIEDWLQRLIGADDQRTEKLRNVKASLSLD
jgi:hypothetical protein